MAPADSITGTGQGGEALSVPVVDLTATVHGLYAHAEQCRTAAQAADALAAQQRREADYLEDLASILTRGTHRD